MLELSHLGQYETPCNWLLCSFSMTLVATDNFLAFRPDKMSQIHPAYFLLQIWNCHFYKVPWVPSWRNGIERSQSRC